MVDQLFTAASRKPLSQWPLRRIAFGRWHAAQARAASEELVACRMAENCVEIHCHGGQAAVEAVVQSLVEQGARLDNADAWAARQEIDRIAAEARLALAQATSERTALVLLDQYHGALRREAEAIIELLASGDFIEARRKLSRLAERENIGRRLTQPWRVVLAGAPNVGKSSLMNALVGYHRSIVFDQPGTTRDVVTATAVLDGWPVELADTAGLREARDTIEREGVALARDEVETADLVILVRDAMVPPSERREETFSRSQPMLVVMNKVDLCGNVSPGTSDVQVSARTGQRIDTFIDAIVQRLVANPPKRGEAVPFTPRQSEVIRASLSKTEQGDAFQAAAHLRRLWQ
jgi:tRNA modification GTPase